MFGEAYDDAHMRKWPPDTAPLASASILSLLDSDLRRPTTATMKHPTDWGHAHPALSQNSGGLQPDDAGWRFL